MSVLNGPAIGLELCQGMGGLKHYDHQHLGLFCTVRRITRAIDLIVFIVFLLFPQLLVLLSCNRLLDEAEGSMPSLQA